MIKICKVYKSLENFVIWCWNMKEAIFYQILTILAGYAVYMEIQIFNEASSFEKMLIVFSVILVLILECLVLNYWNILISERIED